MKMLICGNSKLNLSKDIGKTIDINYDEIVRFNAFQTKGYEKYIGTKTTTWVCSLGKYKKTLKESFLNSSYKKILCNKSKCENDILKQNYLQHKDILILDKIVNDTYMKNTNYPKKYFMSNGFLIILYFLSKYKSLTITNFEFNHEHYYGNRKKPKWKNHDWKFEKQYIQNLIDKNIIKEI